MPERFFNFEGASFSDAGPGFLPNHLKGLLPWSASFGKIADSCVKEIEVRIPIVNYCLRSANSPARMDAWIGRLTPIFNDSEVVSEGFWPYLTIVNQTFDSESCGEEIVYKVSPTDADIDQFLPIRGFNL